MKKTRLISLLLALMLLVSMLPVAASAATVEGWAWRLITRDYTQFHFEDGTAVKVDNDKGWVVESDNDDYDVTVTDQYNPGQSAPVLKLEDPTHVHVYDLEMNREGHFTGCYCGYRKTDVIPHVDVKDAVNGRCTCGYKFNDDATLNVLWISNVKLNFKPDTTEYNVKLLNKDAKAVNISAFTMDAKASLEVSGDMILKDGTNTITLKVTAEDGTQNTYTVNIEK